MGHLLFRDTFAKPSCTTQGVLKTVFYVSCFDLDPLQNLTIHSISAEFGTEKAEISTIYTHKPTMTPSSNEPIRWTAVDFSPSLDFFIAGAADGTLVVRDLLGNRNCKLLTEFGEYDPFTSSSPWNQVFLNFINSVAISENMVIVGTGGSKEIHVWKKVESTRKSDIPSFKFKSSINARHIQYSGIQGLSIFEDKILLMSYENFSIWSSVSFRCLVSHCLVESENEVVMFDRNTFENNLDDNPRSSHLRLILKTGKDLRAFFLNSTASGGYDTFDPSEQLDISRKWRRDGVFGENQVLPVVSDAFQVLSYDGNAEVLQGVNFLQIPDL